jgi:hypothetical protein
MKNFKKLFFSTLFILLILSSCTERTYESNCKGDQSPEQVIRDVRHVDKNYYTVYAFDYYSSNMHYKIFTSATGDVFVVNITKDSIDCLNKH